MRNIRYNPAWRLYLATVTLWIVLAPGWEGSRGSAAAIPYDVNGDGGVNPGDVTSLARQILGWESGPGEPDCNQDGTVDIADLVSLASFLYSHRRDPLYLAPPLDPTVASDLTSSTLFFYTGDDPPQTGVPPGTVEPRRIAVLRGRVLGRDNLPLEGVLVAVLSHPEFGSTLTRTDGMFDMVVNGGGLLTVQYNKDGYIPAQRQMEIPWRDFVWLPDVVLVQYDPKVTVIDLPSATQYQVAQGSAVTDEDGSRTATLLVPPDSHATMTLPSGEEVALTRLAVRATEYTVGENGPAAMPAELPKNTGYTYCVEYSVDEAVAAGADVVQFDKPFIHYSENFIGFPVGGIVPAGYYDRRKGQWVPMKNGRVVEILSIQDGRAELDVKGEGLPADAQSLAELGITDNERERLAGLYQPGQSLWRIPITHFSPVDANWPYGPPAGARGPDPKDPRIPDKPDPCDKSGRSTIEIQNQILGEQAEIAGTPFTLHYHSDRAPGHKNAYKLEIQLSDPTVPLVLKRIKLEIKVAGQKFSQIFPPLAGQKFTWVWNGEDAYGRILQGQHPATIRLGYEYEAVYLQPAALSASFMSFSDTALTFERGRQGLGLQQGSAIAARETITIWGQRSVMIGPWDARPLGFGDWTVNVHHAYDLEGVLHLGDGSRVQAEAQPKVVKTLGGEGSIPYAPDGTLATDALDLRTVALDVGPDGSVYFLAAGTPHQLRRIGPDGILSTLYSAGNGPPQSSSSSDPYWAHWPTDLAIAPDGTIYWSETDAIIRKRDPQGVISNVAGTGVYGFSGDGGPATQAKISTKCRGLACGPNGCLYISDTGNQRIRRVGTDGIITTVAGNGTWPTHPEYEGIGNGGPAIKANVMSPTGITVDPDGSVYFLDAYFGGYVQNVGFDVRRVTPDGIIQTIAGQVMQGGDLGDGGPAIDAQIWATQLAIRPDGTLYLAHGRRTRAIDPAGIINTYVGGGTEHRSPINGLPALGYYVGAADVAVGPNGVLYCCAGPTIYRITSPVPGLLVNEAVVPSDDGYEAYVCDTSGRHLRTVNALTGRLIYRFQYTSRGVLSSIEDGDGNVTTIERDANDQPLAIVGPSGHRTSLALNEDGYLESITNPLGEVTRFTYDAGGLLKTVRNPRDAVTEFGYNADGNLTSEEDAAGGFVHLDRQGDSNSSFAMVVTESIDKVTSYSVETLPTGDEEWNTTWGNGVKSTTLIGRDATRKTTDADGTVHSLKMDSDPRWNLQAPILNSLEIATPQGLKSVATASRSVELANPADPFSLRRATDTLTVNSRSSLRVYDALTRQMTFTSPMGRKVLIQYDSEDRMAMADPGPGLAPITFSYDSQNRLIGLQREHRSTSFTYNAQGLLDSRTDALGREIRYDYDGADRLIATVLPSGHAYEYSYDPAGNLTNITLPNGAVHELAYNLLNLGIGYTPPESGGRTYALAYDQARQLTSLSFPSGRRIDYLYDNYGQMSGITHADADVALTYDSLLGGCCGYARPSSIIRAPKTGLSQTIEYQYDGFLVTTMTWSGAASAAYTYRYDSDFNLAGMTLDQEPEVALVRDADGLLTNCGPFAIERNGPGGAPSRISDNASSITTEYNLHGEVTGRTHVVNGQEVYRLALDRDAGGRLIRKAESVAGATTHTLEYVYDTDGPLKEVRRDGSLVESYAYDLNANRTSSSGVSATYDQQDRLTSLGGVAYQLDVDGFLTQRGADTFQFSPQGELLETTHTAQNVTYAYDGIGRRVGRTDDQGTSQYTYGNPDFLFQLTASRDPASVLTTYFYAESDTLLAFKRDGKFYYVATDLVGSPRVISDADGQIIKILEYDSFGNLLSDSNPAFALPLGFAGGLADPVTGLIRFGLRDYDPAAGRWTARDPLQFSASQANFYTYLGGDPVNGRDPSGFIKLPSPPAPKSAEDLKKAGDKLLKALEAVKDLNNLDDFLNDPNQSPAKKWAAQLRCLLKYAPWGKLPALGDWYSKMSAAILDKGLDNIENYLDKLDKVWDELNKEYYYKDPCDKGDNPKNKTRRKLPCSG